MFAKKPFLYTLFVLAIATLACSLSGTSSSETTDSQATVDALAQMVTAQAAVPAAPATQPEAAPAPQSAVSLGQEITSPQNEYSFRIIPSYSVDFDEDGDMYMEAPNADPNLGPAAMFMLDTVDPNTTLEQTYSIFLEGAEADTQITNKRNTSVGGLPGIAVDIGEQQRKCRVLVVQITSTGVFYIIGGAPSNLWNDFSPLFDAVVDSIIFLGKG